MVIKKIIGITSCKGGVGKTTFSVNFASFLSYFFHKNVGLFDADIYGPNHPCMLGLNSNLKLNFTKTLSPIEKYGLYSLSMGYFVNKKSSVLFRGPMLSNTIIHFLKQISSLDLDFLIIDFPPGTGDAYLSMLRDINFDGVFVVTVPHVVSIEDVERSISMFRKLDVNILAILENMTYFRCASCYSINSIYGDYFRKKYLDSILFDKFYSFSFLDSVNIFANFGIPFIFNKGLCIKTVSKLKDLCNHIL